jgi:hypothetical protein
VSAGPPPLTSRSAAPTRTRLATSLRGRRTR